MRWLVFVALLSGCSEASDSCAEAEPGPYQVRASSLYGTCGPSTVATLLEDVEGVVIRSKTKLDAEAIGRARKLRAIGRAGVGYDNVDVAAANKRGILVMNVPEGNTLAAAEHSVALLLACMRNIPRAHAAMRDGRWDRKHFMGRQLAGKLVGVVTEDAIIQHVFGRPELMNAPVADAMEGAFIQLDRTTSVNNLVAMLHVQPYAAIMDGDEFLGLITRTDVLNYLRRQM